MVLFGSVILATVFVSGREIGVQSQREEALGAGVGRWETDHHTGRARFVYGDRRDPREE